MKIQFEKDIKIDDIKLFLTHEDKLVLSMMLKLENVSINGDIDVSTFIHILNNANNRLIRGSQAVARVADILYCFENSGKKIKDINREDFFKVIISTEKTWELFNKLRG